MTIRLATLDERDIVVDVLNKVTLDLHDKGIQQWEYPWNADKMAIDIQMNHVYVLLKDEQIVGTFLYKRN